MKDTEHEGPGDGHNSIGVDESEFHGFVAQLAGADADVKIARERRQKIRKNAKAAGIRLGDLDFALKVRDLDDDEAQEKLQHTATYLRWMKAAPGVQFELFSGDGGGDFLDGSDSEAEARIMDKAYRDGFVAGLKGKADKECPHDLSGSIGQKWLEGKRDGEESARSSLLKVPDPDAEDGLTDDDEG